MGLKFLLIINFPALQGYSWIPKNVSKTKSCLDKYVLRQFHVKFMKKCKKKQEKTNLKKIVFYFLSLSA